MKKRILSIVVVLAMAFCLLPMAAFATEEVGEINLVTRDPYTGESPSDAYAADAYGYKINWYTLHISEESTKTVWKYFDSESIEQTMDPATDTFQPETAYAAYVTLYTSTGYEFHDPPKITFNGMDAEIVEWNPAEPWHVQVKYSYPDTAPLFDIESVSLTAVEPKFGASPDFTVECEWAEPYTVENVRWLRNGSDVMIDTDVFEADTSYTLEVSLKAASDAKFTETLTSDHCTLNPDWFGDGLHADSIALGGDGTVTLSFTWSIPAALDFIQLSAPEQAYGETPMMYASCEPGLGYSVLAVRWYDETDGIELGGPETLEFGHEYFMEIDVAPEAQNFFGTDVAAKLNETDAVSAIVYADYVTVRAAAPLKEAEAIDKVALVYKGILKVDEEASDVVEPEESGAHYGVLTLSWFDAEDTELYVFKFEEDAKYTLKVTVEPDLGYVFTDETEYRLDGEPIVAMPDGRSRILTKEIVLTTWDPEIIPASVFDLTGGKSTGGFAAEKATLKALAEAGLISLTEDGDTLTADLDKDGTPDIYIAPNEEVPGAEDFGRLETCSLENEVSLAVDEAALAYLKEKKVPAYDQTITIMFPELVWNISFDADGGEGTMDPTTVHRGDSYVLPDCGFTAPEGKVFDAWELGAPGDAIEVTADLTVKALWKDAEPEVKLNPFSDVFETDYFYDAVVWALWHDPQITNGKKWDEENGIFLFAPNDEVKRGEAVTFLWRAMGCPEPETAENPFADVKEGAYYYKAVLWAVENGITTGTKLNDENGQSWFTPAQTCSTAHIITFLYRTLTGKTVAGKDWYQLPEAWAQGAGLLDGLDIEVLPGVMCPRCDVVLFLYRALAE